MLLAVLHYIDRVEVVRINAVTDHHVLRKFVLQRRKPETIALISLQQKLNETVAKSANAIVENNWVGVRSRQSVGSIQVEPCGVALVFSLINTAASAR